MGFPKDFVWGAASASYQIEGGAFEDGKGLSIWDDFSHQAGKTFHGHTGDVACDAYHRYEEDLDLMQELGIKAYRFSVSWPRIFPTGRGEINEKGLAYYERLIDACLARGIEPWVTLYHWDLPLALYEKGGWLNRETAYAFAEYAEVFAKHFQGKVTNYYTFNEPQCVIGLGHVALVHAPGVALSFEDSFLSWHHIVLAHALASDRLRAIDPTLKIGVASTGALTYLDEKKITTPDALVQGTFSSLPVDQNPGWCFNHQWFLDPVILGHYPDDPHHPWNALKTQESILQDMRIISATYCDFIGLNIYNGTRMELLSSDSSSLERDTPCQVAEQYAGFPRTALKWPITPGVLYWGPRLIHERYGLPLMITENGQSCNDKIYLDGKVHDPDRIDFLHRYLLELQAAVEDGIPVTGYFHWSFTDNYEWHSGYDDRFGLIYIDYRDQKRIPKDSASWYKEVIASNGENLALY